MGKGKSKNKGYMFSVKKDKVRVRIMVERKLVKGKDNKILIVQGKFVKDIG